MSAIAVAGPSGKPTAEARRRRRIRRRIGEAPIYLFLFACASLSIFTTVGIVLVLFEEALHFFGHVSIIDFLTDTEWTPLIGEQHFGIIPLLNATVMMAVGAMVFAVPLGLLVAIYLSEYAHPRVRGVIKPVLEVLAGIPTVV
jgi:phosphate transport system permease protein